MAEKPDYREMVRSLTVLRRLMGDRRSAMKVAVLTADKFKVWLAVVRTTEYAQHLLR